MAVACLCHAVSERRVRREIDHGVPPPKPDVRRLPGWAMIGFSGFLVLVSGAVLIGLWSR